MKLWKRNVVAATVLLFVCTAVYLNWKYAGNIAGEESLDVGQKILGESTLVNGEEDTMTEEKETKDEETANMEESGAVKTSSDYFASARLARQEARDTAISMLREAAESEAADTAVANEAAETVEVLAGYAIAEAQVENLITAKGYAECVAFMGEDGISVVVSSEDGLEAADVAKITDIILDETDYTTDQIKILETN